MNLSRSGIAGVMILAGSAGMTNLLTLQTTLQVTVSYMTGNITQMIVEVSKGNYTVALPYLAILIAFFLGSILSGMIVGAENFVFGRRYGIALILEGLLIFLALKALEMNSIWGGCYAAAACGLQNAMVATYSGNVIRTTHMTGVISDIGSFLGNILLGRRPEVGSISLLFYILTGYISGVVTGVITHSLWALNALLVPSIALILSGTTYMVYRLSIKHIKGITR